MQDIEKKSCRVVQLGSIDYNEGWALQRELVRQRSSGAIDDTLLLLAHPHTYTLGRATKDGHILVAPELLAQQGVAVIKSDRGGDITYHGPGQIVGYPILKLSRHGGDVVRYLRMLEDVVIDALAMYGVQGERVEGLTGVWVGGEKICAIGVKLSASGVTHHGFALNITTDLRFFQQIIPCGITDRGVTSLERLLGTPPSYSEVETSIVQAFACVFGVAISFDPSDSDMVHSLNEVVS